MALSGTVYRLASSMSDHTPVLFNVFEDWNEESVVPHISFDLIRNSTQMQAADSQVPNIDTHRYVCCQTQQSLTQAKIHTHIDTQVLPEMQHSATPPVPLDSCMGCECR